jgi:hypothetical protein
MFNTQVGKCLNHLPRAFSAGGGDLIRAAKNKKRRVANGALSRGESR